MLQACTENCQAHISLKAAPGSALAVPGSAPAFLQQLAFVHTLILFQGSFPGWTRMPQPLSADITHIAAATFNHPPNAILLNLDSGSSWRLLLLCLFDIFCFVFFLLKCLLWHTMMMQGCFVLCLPHSQPGTGRNCLCPLGRSGISNLHSRCVVLPVL